MTTDWNLNEGVSSICLPEGKSPKKKINLTSRLTIMSAIAFVTTSLYALLAKPNKRWLNSM